MLAICFFNHDHWLVNFIENLLYLGLHSVNQIKWSYGWQFAMLLYLRKSFRRIIQNYTILVQNELNGLNTLHITIALIQFKNLLKRWMHHFYTGLNEQYGPYAHFWYWTLAKNIVTEKIDKCCLNYCQKKLMTKEMVWKPHTIAI